MKIVKDKQKKNNNMAEEEREREGKTVVVGVRMDQQSRELLTWALVKHALPGDRVVALHIATTSAAADPNALLSVVKEFESVIAVYEGFCNLKQIDLKLKVCRGSSIRKLLVQEAKAFAASKLILGVTNNGRHTIGSSSTSIAKHCAKKLPGDCSVLAVNNGKIVFQRDAPPQPSTENNKAAPKKNPCSPHNATAGSLPAIKGQGRRSIDPGSANADVTLLSSDVSTTQNCSICVPEEPPCTKSREDDTLALVPLPKPEPPSSFMSLMIPELREARPGWPLLRRAVLINRKNSSPAERSKISVVQWAMRLPSRYTASLAVHPDPKHTKAGANGVHNFDGAIAAIVPAGAGSPHVTHNEEKKILRELESLQEKYSSVCRLIGYQELMRATSNFSPDNLVGKGGSSRVYKGCLPDGKELAVKTLKPSDDALQEFISEVEIITSLHHKNIISLFGFCFENTNLILVYDFLSRGSLEETLHGEKENKNVLTWLERYKIAVGVAEALDYLHGGGSSQPVIHRDVKSSNILLADNFEPQLCDFGLARWASASSTHITCSDVAGTFGYLAPEYFMYGKVNEKIDVYAFGVVLLELLSGRKPVSTGCPKGRESLVMWAKPILQGGKVKELVDPLLGDKYDNNQMERMILAASLCIRRAARSRPCMTVVLKLLQGEDDDVLKWARSEVDGSEEFDGLDNEAAPCPDSDIQSHINLALLDIDDEITSVSSVEHSVDFRAANTSLEEYLQGSWSRSSSFD